MVPVSVDLGTAPMTVSSFWPSLKIITVGIERMPYSVATLGLSSVLSFTYEKKNIEDERRDGRVSAGARHSRARRDDWEKKRPPEWEKKLTDSHFLTGRDQPGSTASPPFGSYPPHYGGFCWHARARRERRGGSSGSHAAQGLTGRR